MNGQIRLATTSKMQLIDITDKCQEIAQQARGVNGALFLFNPHTTAGLTINEGADPDVQRDIIEGLRHIVPHNLPYRHAEGNSPAHIMALLTGSSLTILIEEGKMVLGAWQHVFFCEYDGPRTRSIRWKILSD